MDDADFIEALGLRVHSKVISEGSYRKASKASKVPLATLHDIARGSEPSFRNYRRIYRWLTGEEMRLP